MARPQGARAATAIEFAIALFAARPWPEKKLRERLRTRYEPAETEAAIARMRELGMLNDAAWADQFARDRLERGGKGRHRIRAELLARGIDAACVDAALDRTFTGDVERGKAAAVLESLRAAEARKHGGTGRAGEEQPASGEDRAARDRSADASKNRLFRRMLARGYPASLVRDLMGVS